MKFNHELQILPISEADTVADGAEVIIAKGHVLILPTTFSYKGHIDTTNVEDWPLVMEIGPVKVYQMTQSAHGSAWISEDTVAFADGDLFASYTDHELIWRKPKPWYVFGCTDAVVEGTIEIATQTKSYDITTSPYSVDFLLVNNLVISKRDISNMEYQENLVSLPEHRIIFSDSVISVLQVTGPHSLTHGMIYSFIGDVQRKGIYIDTPDGQMLVVKSRVHEHDTDDRTPYDRMHGGQNRRFPRNGGRGPWSRRPSDRVSLYHGSDAIVEEAGRDQNDLMSDALERTMSAVDRTIGHDRVPRRDRPERCAEVVSQLNIEGECDLDKIHELFPVSMKYLGLRKRQPNWNTHMFLYKGAHVNATVKTINEIVDNKCYECNSVDEKLWDLPVRTYTAWFKTNNPNVIQMRYKKAGFQHFVTLRREAKEAGGYFYTLLVLDSRPESWIMKQLMKQSSDVREL